MQRTLKELGPLIEVLVDAALRDLAVEAAEFLNEDGDVPPEYSAEAEPPDDD